MSELLQTWRPSCLATFHDRRIERTAGATCTGRSTNGPSRSDSALKEDVMKSFLAVAVVILLMPAAAHAQKTSFDFDKSADFAKFKTYALKDGTAAGDVLIDKRITAAIESELGAKGLTREDGKPDVVVVYHVAIDKQKEMTAYNSSYGRYGYRWGGGWGTTDVRVNEILVGTLIIDVADAAKQEVVWRGMGVKEVDPMAKADKRDKNINGAVKKIMQNFPPKRKA
jgi:hypothetical protein